MNTALLHTSGCNSRCPRIDVHHPPLPGSGAGRKLSFVGKANFMCERHLSVSRRLPGPERQVSTCARKRRRIAQPSEQEREAKQREDLESISDYPDDVLTQDMLDMEPPGHRAGYLAIIGRPNAGKSTLLNALLGQKLSIVTAKAQTTRHRVLGILSEDNFQLICLDTPGVMQVEKNRLDETMMRSVRRASKDADAVLVIIDASSSPEEALALLQPGKLWGRQPWALVLNKIDKLDSEETERLKRSFEASTSASAVIPTCAITGEGVAAVKDWGVSQLPEGPSLYPKDFVSEHPERFFVAEIIREKIFLQYHEEVPYATSVRVNEFVERPTAKDLIQVDVLVESPTQRAIILGAGGTAIKRMATAARMDIEAFLGRPVYLDISVKVQEKWRKDTKAVANLGY